MKKRKRYFIYGNSGGIAEVIKELNDPKSKHKFASLEEVFHYLLLEPICLNDDPLNQVRAFDPDELSMRWYGYDKRIEKNVFIICTKRYFTVEYDVPQYVRYLVEI